MLLIISDSSDATADYLCSRIAEGQLPLARLDTDTFSERGFVEYTSVGGILLRLNGLSLSPNDIASVVYRRPHGITVRGDYQQAHALHASREWGAALDCFLAHVEQPRWMNHPALNAHASNKLLQLTRARTVGFAVPNTLVSRSPAEVRAFWARFEGQIVVKPLSVGFIEDEVGAIEGQIFTSLVEDSDFGHVEAIALCPTLFQERICPGLDVRVTCVDGELTALGLRPPTGGPAPVDVRKNGLDKVTYEPVTLPNAVADRLRALMDLFHLRFAAIDLIRTTDGRWVFLELNPNGQWAWMDLLGVSDIAHTFIESARRRL